MIDAGELHTAFRKYDLAKLQQLVAADTFRDESAAREFVAILRQSSSLAIQIEDGALQTKRDEVVAYCRTVFDSCADSAITRDFEAHVEDARIIERGYREIFRTLKHSETQKHSPAEQAWSMVRRAEEEFAFVKDQVDKEVARRGNDAHPQLDPRQLRITNHQGYSVRPDAVIHGLVKNAGDTLLTLAYLHGWIEKNTGLIVLPHEVEIDENLAFKAGTYSVVASQWRALETAWDRSRLFRARLRVRDQEFPIEGGGTHITDVLEISTAPDIERMDRIALARLEQVFFQTQIDEDLEGTREPDWRVDSDAPALAKAGYLSFDERVAVQVLEGSFCVPVDDDDNVIAGLSFKNWLRGYAYYASKGQDDAGKPIFRCVRVSEADLVGELVQAGLAEESARKFIALTTFGRGAADLFDTPLLKVSDGSYCFFAPAYHTPTLGVIVLSRIASLNRRRNDSGEAANDAQIKDKGQLFEARVLDLFHRAGFQAAGFKYSIGDTEYDCDVAAIVGDVLFVFECKKRSLPMGHLPSLHYFAMTVERAKRQAKRIASDLNEHPELVENGFGEAVKWQRIVPVVLYSMPWSFGSSDGVYVYDASALAHLMSKGVTSITALSKLEGGHYLKRRHRYPLRKGDRPTAEELEREIRDPNQLRLHGLGWEQEAVPIPVSDALVFSLPHWIQRTSTLEEQMVALGSSPEEARRVAKEMSSDLPEQLVRFRQSARMRGASSASRRNDRCPCGSGKKFKKCCIGKVRLPKTT